MEWCPFFIRADCPRPERQYYPPGPKRGEIKHNAVVNWGNYTPNGQNGDRGGSWHATIMLDGRGYQHFPLSANTWHGGDTDPDGNVRANYDLIGVEHEGISGTLTPAQLDTSVRFTQWAAAQWGYTSFARYPNQTGWTLAEHNQVANPPGTACPTGRVPWAAFFAALVPRPEPPPLPIHTEELSVGVKYAGRQVASNYVVVCIGTDNLLYSRTHSANGWSGFEPVPPQVPLQPGAELEVSARPGSALMDVYCKLEEGGKPLGHWVFDGSASSFENLGGMMV